MARERRELGALRPIQVADAHAQIDAAAHAQPIGNADEIARVRLLDVDATAEDLVALVAPVDLVGVAGGRERHEGDVAVAHLRGGDPRWREGCRRSQLEEIADGQLLAEDGRGADGHGRVPRTRQARRVVVGGGGVVCEADHGPGQSRGARPHEDIAVVKLVSPARRRRQGDGSEDKGERDKTGGDADAARADSVESGGHERSSRAAREGKRRRPDHGCARR